jgi:solute carrier family 15 (oligopeptide transporter), member 1
VRRRIFVFIVQHYHFRAFSFIGLLIGVIASGCIRANLTAFGGNQYKLPEQADQFKFFFSIQIFFLKSGNLVGRFVTPMLRGNVQCFQMADCYPLAFGAPAVMMMVGFVLFFFGKSIFVCKPPGENMVVEVSRCVGVRMLEEFLRDN